MTDKKFNFFESYHRALSRVPDSSYGRVVRSMAEFAFEGVEPTFANDIDNVAWELIRPILEHGQELSQKRAEAGRTGGEHGKGVPRNQGNAHAKKEINSKSIANQKQNNSGKGIGKGIGKEYIKENNKRNNNSVIPDYVDPAFAPIIQEWILYKRERGQSYRPRGLKSCYNKLLELSDNDPIKAKKIIDQSISNNYAGLFNLKDNNYDSINRTSYGQQPNANINEAQQYAISRMQQVINSAGADNQ